jgi:2-hydroxymuconate-semialdehyde hydrolase
MKLLPNSKRPEQDMNKLSERDIEFEGTTIHLYEGGSGKPLVLFHGSGTGASTLSNFRAILEPLAMYFRVIAADLVGYGASGLRPTEPYFDMAMWQRQVQHVVSLAESSKVGLIGHSLSGALALKAAAANPRIAGVVTTATMGVANARRPGSRGWVFPESREQLRERTVNTVIDKSLIDEAEIDRRMKVLQSPGYREYFTKMFAGEQEAFVDGSAVKKEELAAIQCPVILFHGAQDRSFEPEATSLHLSKSIARADVVILANCAHSVALEHPGKFLDIAIPFFNRCLA